MTDKPSFVSVSLTPDHDMTRFDCGNEVLNSWLATQALRAQQYRNASTTVWLDGNRIVAYYSIAPTQIEPTGLPRSVRDGYSHVPAYVLAKLALDRSLHGRRLGGQLLRDALTVLDAVIERAGGTVIVVDPIDENATSFYLHYRFHQIPGSNRLYLPAKSVHAIVGTSPA